MKGLFVKMEKVKSKKLLVLPTAAAAVVLLRSQSSKKIVFVDKTLPQLLTFTCQLLWTIVVSVEAFYLSTIHNSALHV